MQRSYWHHSLWILAIIAVILALGLTSFAAPPAHGLWLDSPMASPTPAPPATVTPVPTLAPTPAPPPTSSPAPIPSATLSPAPPPTITNTPWPTATPSPPLSTSQLTPPAISEPALGVQPAGSPITTSVSLSTTNTSSNLVKLINTFVRYSLYFLLGLGIIFFLVLVFFLYALYRRSQDFQSEE